jgi:hypothetical protein
MFVFDLDHSTAMWCAGPCYPLPRPVGGPTAKRIARPFVDSVNPDVDARAAKYCSPRTRQAP